MQQIKVCPVCEGSTFKNYLSCKDYTVSHETFQLTKCEVCDLVLTNPRPENKKLDKYYISDDYISHTSNANSLIDRVYLLARKFTLNKKLKLISRYNTPSKLLDYGCGTGEFINHCKSNGWNISGVEPSILAREKASALTSSEIKTSIQELREEYFDVITLWHVLEHIPDFDKALKTISKLLNEKGTLFIAVPNYKSFDAEIYKHIWAGYDVPRHLWHFAPSTIKKLLSNQSLTLKEIVPMKLDSFYVSLLSEKYKRNKQSLPGMINAFINGLRSNLKAQKTGDYSSLIYIIQK
ncbi:MAG TPA: class I SAM-dependent methyltransferase [Cyclobacteriaceae bacterium]